MNNRRRNLFYKNGFTLIELIVVFTVIAILSTIGTVSFVSYSRQQSLSQATNDLVQTLNTAKSLSASQLKTLDRNGSGSKDCLDTQTLNGFGVQVYVADQENNQYAYALYMKCVGSNDVPVPLVTDSKWQTPLPKEVAVNLASGAIYDVFFPILSGGMIANTDTIVLTSYGNTKTIQLINGYIKTQ
jgi:prepilin-type N-terminal cleavage/methylation domain-containing protein